MVFSVQYCTVCTMLYREQLRGVAAESFGCPTSSHRERNHQHNPFKLWKIEAE